MNEAARLLGIWGVMTWDGEIPELSAALVPFWGAGKRVEMHGWRRLAPPHRPEYLSSLRMPFPTLSPP